MKSPHPTPESMPENRPEELSSARRELESGLESGADGGSYSGSNSGSVSAHSEPPYRGSKPPLRGEVFDAQLLGLGSGSEAATPKSWHSGWLAAGAALLFCTYTIGAYVGQKSIKPAPIGPFNAQSAGAPLRIHIVGAVRHPGVYTLKTGARVQDVIQKAGGALPVADPNALNLADWATDGSKIEVPLRVKPKAFVAPTPTVIIKEVFVTPPQNAPENLSQTALALAPSAASVAAERIAAAPRQTSSKAPRAPKPGDGLPHALTKSGAESSKVAPEYLQKHPVNLNTATAEQLETLPGIGPAMSSRIIAYRLENGGFKSIEDLDSVKGIGDKRMEKLRLLVRVK